MNDIAIGLEPRNRAIADFIEDYAQGVITYGQLRKEIAALGYNTASLFEMTRHIKPKRLDEPSP